MRIILILAALLFSQAAWSGDCAMNPAPIDVTRIAHNPAVRSFVIGDTKLSLTALLKNGEVIRLVHMGCEHSGAEASLWLDSARPLTDVKPWLHDVEKLSSIAFSPENSSEIVQNLESGKFDVQNSESRIVINSSPASYMSYSVVISMTEQGALITITYVLG